jgi:PAS domain S-box-containing protein/diguanylate cyclase (GGDEF)-like protein
MRKPINERELVARIDGIFARRAQEQAVRETARLAEESMEKAALGVGLLELDGRWLRANKALCAMLGYSELELRQLTLDEVTAPEDVGVERPYLEAALDGQSRGFQVEKRLRRADGEYVWLLLSVAAISREGRPPLLVMHVQNAGERRAAEQALRRLKLRDEQTGLLRRREFERRLGRHIRRARGAGALLLVDIDDFGSLNREMGRTAADRVLRAVAKALQAAAPNGAPIGRIDGDRFAILVVRTDETHADAVAAAVAAAVGERTTRVSVSVGGVMLSPDSSIDTAFAAAEEALLEARRTGSRCLATR